MRSGTDAILADDDHRPWPLPRRPWLMTQRWHDLLFAHWAVDAGAMRALVPRELELDRFDGTAWLGVVPFMMTDVRPRGVPPVPWLSAFAELNVRTYVRVGGKPGVFFFSLDAARLPAVLAARVAGLPYFWASMRTARKGVTIAYRSVRRGGAAALTTEYAPVREPFHAAPGSLDYFLTERYCLYARDLRGRAYRLEIHHRPWELQPAVAEFEVNTMGRPIGQPLAGEPLLHFSRWQQMLAWGPEYLS